MRMRAPAAERARAPESAARLVGHGDGLPPKAIGTPDPAICGGPDIWNA